MKRGQPLRSDPAKLRAWQDASRTELERTGPLPKRNAKRKAKRAADDHTYGSFYRWVRDNHGCAVAGEGDECFGEIDGHHIRSVGAGGRDAANVSPLCRKHHTLWHTIGPKAFDARFFNDLRLYAEALWIRYCSLFDGEGA